MVRDLYVVVARRQYKNLLRRSVEYASFCVLCYVASANWGMNSIHGKLWATRRLASRLELSDCTGVGHIAATNRGADNLKHSEIITTETKYYRIGYK